MQAGLDDDDDHGNDDGGDNDEYEDDDDHGNDEGGDDDEYEDNHLRGSRLLVGGCSLLMPSWHLDPPPASCKSLASPLDPPASCNSLASPLDPPASCKSRGSTGTSLPAALLDSLDSRVPGPVGVLTLYSGLQLIQEHFNYFKPGGEALPSLSP